MNTKLAIASLALSLGAFGWSARTALAQTPVPQPAPSDDQAMPQEDQPSDQANQPGDRANQPSDQATEPSDQAGAQPGEQSMDQAGDQAKKTEKTLSGNVLGTH